MDAYIKKIYDMLYSPIITPYNLLENVKLENYDYVKYYTNQVGVVAEMECTMLDDEKNIFFYQFDKKDYLQIIYQGSMEPENIIFDRRVAANVAKQEYFKNKKIFDEVV